MTFHFSLAICEIAKSPGSRFLRAVYKVLTGSIFEIIFAGALSISPLSRSP